ncbi:hypothetical protein JXA27_07310 [Aerococcaceae bacterium zg-B36]|uniref:hypothetical protein n=1 Tax=Aerococcaceae bacterium zg-252 TaxID=2796928 RepID=UPI001BD8CC43|nr:hypothetical protein [Aerococcaceae bacterium zg-B36]
MKVLTKYLILLSIITLSGCGLPSAKKEEVHSCNVNDSSENVEKLKTAAFNSITSIMFGYQKNNQMFLRTSSANEDYFYNMKVPNELLSNAYYDGEQVSFQWCGYTIGKGETFELIECFVNKYGTEIIIFAKKGKEKYVFQSTSAPSGKMFELRESTDSVLNEFLE